MGGYVGKILEVNLTHGTTAEISLPPETLRKFMGGSGLCAHLFFERKKWTADPLGPDNDLFVMTGRWGRTTTCSS